jgi:hypothetical protein
MSAALKRWGVPSPMRALVGLLLLPVFVIAAGIRAAWRGDARRPK